MIGQWVNLDNTKPPLDVWIVARTENVFGLGHHVEAFSFDSDKFTSEEVVMFLQGHSHIEWVGLAP